jgi:hypothetical protein
LPGIAFGTDLSSRAPPAKDGELLPSVRFRTGAVDRRLGDVAGSQEEQHSLMPD